MKPQPYLALAALIAVVTASPAVEPASLTETRVPVSIRVYPPNIDLTTARDHQSVIVQSVFADGITEDVTDQTTFSLGDATLARLESNVIYPKTDGSTELKVEYASHQTVLPVVVKDSGSLPPVSFKLDVMPIFMRAGCNTGSCHGAARGKDGFMLSLFGYDPDGDHFRLTRQFPGRRINLSLPEESLLIQKSIGSVPHTGGKRFAMESEYAQTLLRWHQAGAANDPGEVPRVTKVEVFPETAVLDGEGTTQRVSVRAHYADGTDRDVTSLASFLSNNDNSAPISADGMVTAANRGEAFIMARFDTHTVGSHVIVLPKALQFQWNDAKDFNYVDTHIHAKLRKLRINPSDICSDEEYLRRATLDIVGMLPTIEEYERFVADDDPKKRDKLVDELLDRKEFVELWVMKWAELLMIRTTQQIAYKPMLRYYNWLQEKLAAEVPIDKMVQELLSASGGTFENAATNYYQMETDPLKVSENVAQVFMGMRIQCAQCHNHPFDRWTMDDYYSFAAFFSQIGRKQAEDPRETIVFNSGGGEVKHPVDGRVMAPKFLGSEAPDVAGKDRRAVMADWLASKDNPYFAPNLANIVWNHFFGKGIINEVDDVRVSNPPVNAELMAALSESFIEYNYDFKRLVRDICTSRTYQLSTATNETNKRDDRNFSHASLRRIRSEILLDSITQATDTKNKFAGLPLGARAVQISNGNTSTYFLTSFGRATRASVCSCEVQIEPNLSQALHLLNGETVGGKIGEGKLVERRLAEGKQPAEIVDELYVRCLTRKPTDIEKQKLGEAIATSPDVKVTLDDIFWALLNSREFVFNH
ncbi:DUF1549 and DUF1553 domain-containing protein [Stieleria sp. ICT_E10.1]|uniref:DUF1549 and DUF1553 domain-containing protein n=1 Tax=Stieleria sedimenti TaxID=2976331 RepID=UPI0021801F34|nr:DUF1549 and DUF1553 domain-containing protein [Stieleria sedimenti]MCS7466084.1 DUF1549 and DUF1553 domain-containing protein [Stieleria sedimenti]